MTLTYPVYVIPLILFNRPLFSKTYCERMKTIGDILPEIFDVLTSSHATHFPPGKERLRLIASHAFCTARVRYHNL